MTDVEFLKANHIAPCTIAEPRPHEDGEPCSPLIVIAVTVAPFLIMALTVVGLAFWIERYV